MSTWQNNILRGTRAAQPAATAVVTGALYYVTDESKTERSTGAAWQDVSDGGTVADNSITNAKLRDSSALSVIGRSANSTGDPADISAGAASGAVLRESSSVLGFGTVVAAGLASDAVTTAKILNANVTYAKIQDVSATSRVLGRKTAAAGVVEEATLSEILDFVGSAAQGDVLYRGAATWTRLGAGTSGHFLKTQGAGANPVWDAASGGSVEVLRSRVVITDSQIQSLNTTPITIVAAPGVGKYINIHSCFTVKQSTAGAYSATPNFSLRYASGSAVDIAVATSLFLASANKRWAYLGRGSVGDTAAADNIAVVARLTADVTGGNAANYLVVDVTYDIVNDGP